MASSKMEYYQKGRNGKINIDWHGQVVGGTEVFHKANLALKLVDKALIVAHFAPGTGSTCLRMILHLVREAENLGKEVRVVLPNKEQFNAAEITGFTKFYKVFLTELEALEDLNITDFYPLVLINIADFNPDPIAA